MTKNFKALIMKFFRQSNRFYIGIALNSKEIMKYWIFGAYKQVKDILLPPSCAICGGESLSEQNLCAECFGQISFLPAYKCKKCGFKAEQLNDEMICGDCSHHPPIFDYFYGVSEYDEFSASLISRLKFGDQLYLLPCLSHLMASAFPETEESERKENMIITGVPIYWRRRLKRRYNQSDELARYIARYKNISFIPNLVQRIRYTEPQLGKTGSQRRKNLKQAFRLNKKYENIKNAHVILVDDVMTTGTTLQSVAKILKKQNCTISVLVFARVEGHLY